MALHVGVQLFEQICCVLSAKASKVLIFQEEVNAQVCFRDDSGVLYGELADAGQDQVLECLSTDHAGPVVDEKDVRVLKRQLTAGPPQPQLSVVPALVRSRSFSSPRQI